MSYISRLTLTSIEEPVKSMEENKKISLDEAKHRLRAMQQETSARHMYSLLGIDKNTWYGLMNNVTGAPSIKTRLAIEQVLGVLVAWPRQTHKPDAKTRLPSQIKNIRRRQGKVVCTSRATKTLPVSWTTS